MTLRRAGVAAAAFAFLAAIYIVSTYRDLDRGPHVDEIEHLHTATRMARGERIYIDFAQHHPPLFYAMLMPFVPRGNGVEAMEAYCTRVRLLVAVLTAIAVAASAFVVWRAAGEPWTVVIFVALVFAAGGVWRNGLGDIRPDSTAAALWWLGTALALLEKRPALRGFGLGLIFVAALVSPKWPLMSLVVGVAFLIDLGRNWRGFAAAAAVAGAVAAAGIAATARLADLRTLPFYVAETTNAMLSDTRAAVGSVPGASPPAFFGCPLLLRPLNVALAGALVVLALLRARHAFAAPRLVVTLILMAVASLCEVRLLMPYPAVDFRYYVNWVFVMSAVIALASRSATLLPTRNWTVVVTAVAVSLSLVAATDIIGPRYPRPDLYWRSSAWLTAQLRPGDTVWLGAWRHPIGAADASYLWYGDKEVMPAMLRLASTERGRRYLPPLTESDLPPCRVERGLDPHVRFLIEPLKTVPVARGCFQRLVRRKAILSTPFPQVWMVPRSPVQYAAPSGRNSS